MGTYLTGTYSVIHTNTTADFDKYVYRLAEKCYEFKTKIVKCPETGAIEAFRSCSSDAFQRRISPIPHM